MTIRSLRELFLRLPADGHIRHELRSFNLGMMGAARLPSVLELARRLGFDVVLTTMRKGQRGRLVQDAFAANGYRIEVNEGDDTVTRRWTVLHEMIHALIHRRHDPFASDQYRAGPAHFYMEDELEEEREANAFVEALVFGDGALAASVSLHGRDISKLAQRFGVSAKTMEIALQKLDRSRKV
ncbi:ImmA/IrrE family metallo-endopeptidase [Tabrizicola sp.]|uniref:ImmA/IrrE family metallo-endopeptidase n=1 Tax=Tabrizicola sp. TaxID=2005166 RepID=UPI002FDEEFF1